MTNTQVLIARLNRLSKVTNMALRMALVNPETPSEARDIALAIQDNELSDKLYDEREK